MKAQTGIWIDTNKAIVVKIKDKMEDIFEIESKVENRIHHEDEGQKGSFMGTQHISSEKSESERREHQINNYLKEVLSNISDSEEIFLFGPGETKGQLKQRILNDKSLAPVLKSVETADSMTENQVVAKVKSFFNGHEKKK